MNSVNLIGRLTKNVEVKMTTGAQPVAVTNFSLAVDKQLKKADAEARKAAGQQTADFISCVAWRQSAQYLGQYAQQGTLVAVSGSLQTRSYQNQTGQTVYVTEVVCDNVKILANGKQNNAQPQPQMAQPMAQQYAAPAQAQAQAPVQQAQPQIQQPIYQQQPIQQPVSQAPQQMNQAPQPIQEGGVYLDITSEDLPFY